MLLECVGDGNVVGELLKFVLCQIFAHRRLKTQSLQHPVCESGGFFSHSSSLPQAANSPAPMTPFWFSLSIKWSCIDKPIYHDRGTTAHQMANMTWGGKKKMLMEMSLSVVQWNWGLQCYRRMDWSWTAAVSMSILIQCPSLIVSRDQATFLPRPAPLPVRTWLFSTSTAAQLWCPAHEENKENSLCWLIRRGQSNRCLIYWRWKVLTSSLSCICLHLHCFSIIFNNWRKIQMQSWTIKQWNMLIKTELLKLIN